MLIKNIISYLGAWDKIHENNANELSEIEQAITNLVEGNIKVEHRANDRYRGQGVFWDKALFDLGWKLNEHSHYAESGRRIHFGQLGPTKNGISVIHGHGNPSMFNRWLFTHGNLGVRHGLVKIPALIIPMKNHSEDSRPLGYFEYILDQLQMLAPLSAQHPFLIFGYSDSNGDLFESRSPHILEIESDPNITFEKIVVDRCLEFPPEYHQAGLGILNYFGTFLRENYNDKSAKVKIEQSGLNVRLVVETEDGNKEIIEQALKDYELIISGAELPEKIAKNDKIVLELKTELRIAEVRVESQRDIIGLQDNRIEKLLSIVGDGLKQNPNINVSVSPVINNQQAIVVNQDVTVALDSISEVLDLVPASSDVHIALSELSGSLEAIETEVEPSKVKDSPAMLKYKRILESIENGGNKFSSSLKTINDGAERISDLARNYNKIASWCGLPVVPEQLLKNKT